MYVKQCNTVECGTNEIANNRFKTILYVRNTNPIYVTDFTIYNKPTTKTVHIK